MGPAEKRVNCPALRLISHDREPDLKARSSTAYSLGISWGLGGFTSCPVQKIGQCSQGSSLAWPSHVLKYGFLTIKGRTGASRVALAVAIRASVTAVCIIILGIEPVGVEYRLTEYQT